MDKAKIVLNSENVGELTGEGDIVTDNTRLQKLVVKIKGKKLSDMRSIRNKNGELYFTGLKIGKGDEDYRGVVAELLFDEGYSLQGVSSD